MLQKLKKQQQQPNKKSQTNPKTMISAFPSITFPGTEGSGISFAVSQQTAFTFMLCFSVGLCTTDRNTSSGALLIND